MKESIPLSLFSFFWGNRPPLSTIPWGLGKRRKGRSVRLPYGTGPYPPLLKGGVRTPPPTGLFRNPGTGPYPSRDWKWKVTNNFYGIFRDRSLPFPRLEMTGDEQFFLKSKCAGNTHPLKKFRGTKCCWDSKPEVSSTNTTLQRSCGNKVGRGSRLWMVTLNKSQCGLGWELFGDWCRGAWAPSWLSRYIFFNLILASWNRKKKWLSWIFTIQEQKKRKNPPSWSWLGHGQ